MKTILGIHLKPPFSGFNADAPVTTVLDTTVPDTSQNLSINPATIGEIAGIAIGVVIVILLAVLIVAVLIKKRKPMIFKRMKSMGYEMELVKLL